MPLLITEIITTKIMKGMQYRSFYLNLLFNFVVMSGSIQNERGAKLGIDCI